MDVRNGIRRGAQRLAPAALLLVAAPLHDARSDDAVPLAPAPLLDRIGRAAADLAKRGRRAETEELIDVAAALHAPPAALTALKDASAKTLAKAAQAPLPIPDAVKALTKIATDLAATLPALDGDAKAVVAAQVLRIDGANRAAHEALGDVDRHGAWWPAALAPVLERRGAVENAIREARRIDVAVTAGVSADPAIEHVHGHAGAAATSGNLTIESASFGAERLARQLREVQRAAALANWVLNGELKVPERREKRIVLVFDRHEDYAAALDDAQARHAIRADTARIGKPVSANWDDPLGFVWTVGESQIGSWVFLDALYALEFNGSRMYAAPIPLRAGVVNWVCMDYLGCPMPKIAWTEKPEDRRGATSDTPAQQSERDEMLRFSKAGFAGLRMWMKWLARRGEDPPWARSMVDQLGKIAGNDLTKCTLVVDHLVETGRMAEVTRAAWSGGPGPATFEKALGEPLPDYERRWHQWLLAGDPAPGLVQTLGAAPAETTSPAERACLAYLDDIRRRALGKDTPGVGLERELSNGCAAHALYLDRHPKQLAAWPDAHEEYAGEEGFSPEGSRAGLSSVIAPGVSGPEAAIDGWMGTFYHRLPLLAPGLVRIGWGLEKSVAVLDACSLVAPPVKTTWVAWPPAGATGVPRRFNAELPSPVPGADQSVWGYPVTLQAFSCAADPDVRMRLYVGTKRGGTEVACHFSTPNAPTNTRLAPAGAFCLIPKQTLAPGTTYTVAVDGWPKDSPGADWQFTTGR